jgi:DNA-binding response OmpR family regulator
MPIQAGVVPAQRWEVLIVSSDKSTIRGVQEPLLQQGYQTRVATSERAGLSQVISARPDVIVLDVSSDEYNGWELCGRLRELTTAPILLLSQSNDDRELVKGIHMGADLYMPKPVHQLEFLARIQSLLRPALLQYRESGARPIVPTHFALDPVNGTVSFGDRTVRLTTTELRLFSYLAGRCNMVVPQEELLEAVWGIRDRKGKGNLHLYIGRLRQKLEADPKNPKYIHTNWGVGYWLSTMPLSKVRRNTAPITSRQTAWETVE